MHTLSCITVFIVIAALFSLQHYYYFKNARKKKILSLDFTNTDTYTLWCELFHWNKTTLMHTLHPSFFHSVSQQLFYFNWCNLHTNWFTSVSSNYTCSHVEEKKNYLLIIFQITFTLAYVLTFLYLLVYSFLSSSLSFFLSTRLIFLHHFFLLAHFLTHTCSPQLLKYDIFHE